MRFSGILILSMGLAMAGTPKVKVDILVKNASIIDLSTGSIFSNQVILIQQDTIFATGGDSLLRQFSGKTEIDADSKFILPGLWDNHVHFGGAAYVDENEQLLPLYLTFGVTAVRDAAGDIALKC